LVSRAAKSGEDSTSSDIVRGPGVRLGSGWGTLETFHNETFRWVENDAQIFITSDKPGPIAISLLVEPGPGVGGKAFLLRALDASGRQVEAVLVDGRRATKLFLPVERSNQMSSGCTWMEGESRNQVILEY